MVSYSHLNASTEKCWWRIHWSSGYSQASPSASTTGRQGWRQGPLHRWSDYVSDFSQVSPHLAKSRKNRSLIPPVAFDTWRHQSCRQGRHPYINMHPLSNYSIILCSALSHWILFQPALCLLPWRASPGLGLARARLEPASSISVLRTFLCLLW